jgi:hypothetical protein
MGASTLSQGSGPIPRGPRLSPFDLGQAVYLDVELAGFDVQKSKEKAKRDAERHRGKRSDGQQPTAPRPAAAPAAPAEPPAVVLAAPDQTENTISETDSCDSLFPFGL